MYAIGKWCPQRTGRLKIFSIINWSRRGNIQGFYSRYSPTFPLPFLIFSLYYFFHLFQHVLPHFPASQLLFYCYASPLPMTSLILFLTPLSICHIKFPVPTPSSLLSVRRGEGFDILRGRISKQLRISQSSEVAPCQPSNVVNSLEKSEQLLISNKSNNLL